MVHDNSDLGRKTMPKMVGYRLGLVQLSDGADGNAANT